MYYQLPLEQLVRHRLASSQIEFAWEALAILEDSEDARFHPSTRGLALYGAHEGALEPSLAILRDRYGDIVDIRPPRVRCLSGRPIQQPVMALRITVPCTRAQAVRDELQRRDACILEECVRGPALIVHAEAPLRNLMGLGQWLRDTAGREAHHAMRLARYEP